VDATLQGLLGLIHGTDVEVRCAALLALTYLEAAQDPVVQAVGKALNSPNVVVRDFAIGYFERVRPREGVAFLLPLLDAQEDAVRARVVTILEQYGATAVTAVKKLANDAPRRRVNAIIDLCARVHTSPALDLLFVLIGADDPDTNRAACNSLMTLVPTLDTRARADLFARTERLAAGAKGHRAILVAAAKLFSALGDPKARRVLFAMLDEREPPVVRTHALSALTNCMRQTELSAAEVDVVLSLLNQDDEAGFLRPAVRLLETQPLDRRYLGRLNQLAESPQPLVKRFAVEKLGHFESSAAIKTLIGYLTDDSYARRNQAVASLKTMPAARSALMKEFIECEDERKSWTLADILLLHDRNWKRDVLDALSTKLEQAIDKREDRLWAAYFHFLIGADAEHTAARLRARAERLRKSKHFAQSAKTLALLKDSPAFDEETRFAFGLAALKSHAHTLASVAQRHDDALDALRGLANSAFPLGERLRRERMLTPEELYYLAFHLAEGQADEQALARELLEHLVARVSRTKVGQAAKNKLRLLRANERRGS
jgi:hypothetical protein